MKKLSALVAGAALSAVAVGAATPVTTAASALPVVAASHEKSTDRGAAPSEAEIAALFDRWNTALRSGDPDQVAALYAPDAVLLPTASPQIRTTHAEIVDYFEHFVQRKPSGTKLRTVVEVLDNNTAIDTGVYRFTLTNADGTTQQVDARYTYVYEKRDGKWWIVNHHSSVLPPAT
jgi:uncharacterized protein (TIGR02246 family)